MMYIVLYKPEEGFQKHYCPVCKTEYDCLAASTTCGCDDENYERICLDCLGIQLGVDFVSHVKIKNVEDRSPWKEL